MASFEEMLKKQWADGKFVCVGLDSNLALIPPAIRFGENDREFDIHRVMFDFNRVIVDATKDIVCAYKPNVAFYKERGEAGIGALADTIQYIRAIAPDVPVILDGKYNDIGTTCESYATAAFKVNDAHAATVNPYLGGMALEPFLSEIDRGVIVLCRTSNPGAGEFQDRIVSVTDEEAKQWGLTSGTTMPFYQLVAYRVSREWNANGNCALVVGATYPTELREVRNIVADMPILIPGIGTQGGDVKEVVEAGKDSHGEGMIINSSRGIIFASSQDDFAEAARREARKLHTLINQHR